MREIAKNYLREIAKNYLREIAKNYLREIAKNYLKEIANFAIELPPSARLVISLWVTGMERKSIRGVQYSLGFYDQPTHPRGEGASI